MSCRWSKPPDGFVKLNVDGSFREGEQRIGGGGVVRNCHGKWEAAFSSMEPGENAFMAELLAICDGLHMTWNAGFRRVIVETDCA